MIGRISGKYPPPGNPLLYRIKNSNTNRGHIVHQYENDKSATHFNQLDSMHNFRDNIPGADNQFERFAVMIHNLQEFGQG